MKYALFTHVPWPQDTDTAKLLSYAADEVCLAEDLGFSSAWIAEHHFTRYGVGSSALVIAAYIAGRTNKIRLGTGVLIPTLHNPIRLAEDAATMDAISGGRLDVGFGRGVYGYEYSGFGVDPATSQEHFQESVNVIEGLWTNPEFSHNGRFYSLDKVSLAPPPLQKPHPPIYIAATRTPETLDYCISKGHNLCIAVVMDTVPALDLLARFVRKSAESGTNKPASEVPFFRYMYVAETNEQARKDTAAHLEWVLDMLFWRGWFKDGGSEIYHDIEEWRRTRTETPVALDYVLENRAIIGDPDYCIARIEELKSAGVEYLGANFAMGGLDHKKVLRSMELFAKEVMPHIGMPTDVRGVAADG